MPILSEFNMHEPVIRLFDSNNIDLLPWPDNPDGDYAKRFLPPLIKNGVPHYIDNIETNMMALLIDNLVLPITVNEAQYHNSYVCSPYGHYVGYAKESISHIAHRFLGRPLKSMIWLLGKILRQGEINKVVVVNNWLFSTNLYPKINQEQIAKISNFLKKKFPQYAIVFRSVSTYENRELYLFLKSNKFQMIASRQVYFINTLKESTFQSRMYKSDLKALRESTHELVKHQEIKETDIDRIEKLYRAVYLDRHSSLNPQLNVNFIKLALENQLLYMQGLRKDGCLDAVAGYYCRNGVMMSPLLGYDTKKSKNSKLYRITSVMLTQEAKDKKLLYHLSSGAAVFKKLRRAEGNIEYMAVQHDHLPFRRRLPWRLLRWVMNSFGIIFMKRYDK